MNNEFCTALSFYTHSQSKNKTSLFFEKYWLPSRRLDEKWVPIVNSAFKLINNDSIFNIEENINYEKFRLKKSPGGLTLTESQLANIKTWANTCGDRSFSLIEHQAIQAPHSDGAPPLRFEFPIDISWRDLNDGGFISLHLFGLSSGNYFLAGDSGAWIIYAGNDWDPPVDVILYVADLIEILR